MFQYFSLDVFYFQKSTEIISYDNNIISKYFTYIIDKNTNMRYGNFILFLKRSFLKVW